MRPIKSLLSATVLAVMLVGCASQNAANNPPDPKNPDLYVAMANMPDMRQFLPAPPETKSARFKYDVERYKWGKKQRQGARLKQALENVSTKPAYLLQAFSPAFGAELSAERTPEIAELARRTIKSVRSCATTPKDYYKRLRPFVYFKEDSGDLENQQHAAGEGSYPSGHSIRGWGLALVLASINPDRQNEILKYGYEYGESRVILGYHWQSDVDISRMLASACVARIGASPEFRRDLEEARAEFNALKTQP